MVGNVNPIILYAPHKCFQLGFLLIGGVTKPYSDGERQDAFIFVVWINGNSKEALEMLFYRRPGKVAWIQSTSNQESSQ